MHQVHEKRVGLERILRAGGAQIVTLGAAEAAGPPLTHVLVANGHGGEGMAAGDARIWRKMQRKGIGFSQVYDIRAVRILVPEIKDCYATLGMVHGLWRNIPNEFDDYIANPCAGKG